jgi:hypothetical protein
MKTSADATYEYEDAPRGEDNIIKRRDAGDVLSMAYHYFSTGRVRWH